MRGGERVAAITAAVGPDGEALVEHDNQRLDLVCGCEVTLRVFCLVER